MENPEEVLHSLEEFSKLKPKDIPKELEDYLCFVAKTGDPVYQWSAVKSLFREKLVNVITDFYESCPSIDIPPCPNVDVFNYDMMKNFILEKLDTFAAAPFTVQRICELLTTPRKEYNRIDKYMRALEKNILVVSTTEPGNRRTAENGESILNGIETEHSLEINASYEINVEEIDETIKEHTEAYLKEQIVLESSTATTCTSSSGDGELTTETLTEESLFVSIEPVDSEGCSKKAQAETDVSVTITAVPAAVHKRRDSIEPATPSEPTAEVTPSKVSIQMIHSFEATVTVIFNAILFSISVTKQRNPRRRKAPRKPRGRQHDQPRNH